MSVWRSVVAAMVLACVCVSASAQQAGRRVALVIGNSAYASQGTLANPGPDSRLVADALRKVGFAVIPVNDAGKQAMERALRDFSRQADGAEVALVYYAGHGMEANGVNWLLPVDATLADERDLSFEGISLDAVLATVERARGLRMVVLDACRNNPFTRSMRRAPSSTRAVTRGLADVEVTGTLVVYSARAGTVALDGQGQANSPFASAFARRATEAGVDVQIAMRRVRDDVLAATGRAQEPFSYGSLPGVALELVSATGPRPPPPPPPPVTSSAGPGGVVARIDASTFGLDQLHPRVRTAVQRARQQQALAKSNAQKGLDYAARARAVAQQAASGASGLVNMSEAGTTYQGQPHFGRAEAFAVITVPDGTVYAGSIDGTSGNIILSGYGVLTGNGVARELRGRFVNGFATEAGVIFFSDGTFYEGGLNATRAPVHGVSQLTDGLYEGELTVPLGPGPAQTLARQGIGVNWFPNGRVFNAGRFDGGNLVEPLISAAR